MDTLRNLVNRPLPVAGLTVGALVALHLVGLATTPVLLGVAAVGALGVVRAVRR